MVEVVEVVVEVVVVDVEVVDIVVVVEIILVVDDEESEACEDDGNTDFGAGIDVVMEASSSSMSGASVTDPEDDVEVNQDDHHESSVVVSSRESSSSADTTSRSYMRSDGFIELRSSNVTGQAPMSLALLSPRKFSPSRLGSMRGSMGSLVNIMSSLVFAPYSSPISGADVVSLDCE